MGVSLVMEIFSRPFTSRRSKDSSQPARSIAKGDFQRIRSAMCRLEFGQRKFAPATPFCRQGKIQSFVEDNKPLRCDAHCTATEATRKSSKYKRWLLGQLFCRLFLAFASFFEGPAKESFFGCFFCCVFF